MICTNQKENDCLVKSRKEGVKYEYPINDKNKIRESV
jgi:hypothetical protein